MKRAKGLIISLVGLMLMTTPAFASDYGKGAGQCH